MWRLAMLPAMCLRMKAHEVSDALAIFAEKGDLAHVALFLWASAASALLVWSLKEQAASNQRFQDFVEEIAHLTRILGD